MGLDTTHDAFHGAYSAFNRFRQCIAEVSGCSYPPHKDISLDNESWYWNDELSKEEYIGLYTFLNHSDCDGEIDYQTCEKLANELESYLPQIQEYQKVNGLGGGHIEANGGFVGTTKQFIDGCREAAKLREDLLFQ